MDVGNEDEKDPFLNHLATCALKQSVVGIIFNFSSQTPKRNSINKDNVTFLKKSRLKSKTSILLRKKWIASCGNYAEIILSFL